MCVCKRKGDEEGRGWVREGEREGRVRKWEGVRDKGDEEGRGWG